MSVKVRIPTPLRRVTGGKEAVNLVAKDIGDCIGQLGGQFPGMKERLCDDRGDIRPFVNIYVNGEDVRFLQGMATPLKPGDEVSIVPAMAGGI